MNFILEPSDSQNCRQKIIIDVFEAEFPDGIYKRCFGDALMITDTVIANAFRGSSLTGSTHVFKNLMG